MNDISKKIFRFINDMKIQYKIGSGFLLCALLFLGNYVMIKYIQRIENKAGQVIVEIAGRNRMLSQKIAMESEALFRGKESVKADLVSDIELHEKSLEAIKKGGNAPGINSNMMLPPAPDELLPVIAEVDDYWKQYRGNAEKIIEADDLRNAKDFVSLNHSEQLKRNNELVKVFTKYFTERKFTDAKVVAATMDLAGRNRMLSQRVGLIALQKLNGLFTAAQEEDLRKAIELHHQSLAVLKNGGLCPETDSPVVLPPPPVEVLPAIAQAEELWNSYRKNAEVILNEKENFKAIEFIEHGYPELLMLEANLVNAYTAYLEKEKNAIVERLNTYLTVVLFFNLLMAVGAIWLTLYFISKPITSLATVVDHVADGDLTQRTHYDVKDEIGLVSTSVNKLIDNQKKAADFAVHIGDGKFEDEFSPVSEKDTLGISLINMRDKLKTMSQEDKKRNWATEGLAKFGEILRLNNDNLQVLGNNIISSLVKYMKANQGGLFIINDNHSSDPCLELIACYAYERKKFVEKKVALGEGLVGQAWQEGEYIYLTDVPDDYVHITSGLGEATPRSVLIMPLKVNEITFGVIEIASFIPYEKHEIEFVQKLSESIASTVSTAKINERTKRLLHESQQQAEELKAQEEEMRQNMEEMTATQEEMQRKEAELQRTLEHSKSQEEEMRQNMEELTAQQEEMQRKENELQRTLEHTRLQEEQLKQNMEEMAAAQEEMVRVQMELQAQMNIVNATALVSKTDLKGFITYANDEFCRVAKYSREELIGKNHNIVRHPDMPKEAFADLWRTIGSGKVWRGQVKNKAKDGSYYWVDATIAPIMASNGKPKEYMGIRYLITAYKDLENELQALKIKKQ